jgi:hypothetical protein
VGKELTNETDRIIRERFRVKSDDTLPYTGLLDSTRVDLAKLFAELGFQTGAEIGVCNGEYSEVLLSENPNLTRLLCIDPWSAYLSPWSFRVTQQRADDRLQRAQKRLKRFHPYVDFIRKTSIEAAKEIPDGSLDFVYLDGLHDFDNVMLDLIHWSKKVRPLGIMVGHDYWYMYGGQVPAAVDAYTRAHQINSWYITREQAPSFFWVKR